MRFFVCLLIIAGIHAKIVDVGCLKIDVLASDTIHVWRQPVPDNFTTRYPSPVVNRKWPDFDKFSVSGSARYPKPSAPNSDSDRVIIRTAEMTVEILRGLVSVVRKGTTIWQEQELQFAELEGSNRDYVSSVAFKRTDERFFGLGAFQNGLADWSDIPLNLIQFNTEAIVPFVMSSKGYGVLFPTTGWSAWNMLGVSVVIDVNGTTCSVTGGATGDDSSHSTGGQQRQRQRHGDTAGSASAGAVGAPPAPPPHVYHGSIDVSDTTDVGVLVSCCASGRPNIVPTTKPSPPLKPCWAGDNFFAPVTLFVQFTRPGFPSVSAIAWESIFNLPSALAGRAHLPSAGTWNVTLTTDCSSPSVLVRETGHVTRSFSTRSVDRFDYYLFAPSLSSEKTPSGAVAHGGDNSEQQHGSADAVPRGVGMHDGGLLAPRTAFDAVISAYRYATGSAVLYPLSAYGFWQCKERYKTQAGMVAAAAEFRSRGLPIDNIVQDWKYWGDLGWGPHWDKTRYPDPRGMVEDLHGMNVHLMVSVWSKFKNTTVFAKEFQAAGEIFATDPFSCAWFDATNPAAAARFYAIAKARMFDIGVDYLWLDATEPQSLINIGSQMHVGTGFEAANPFSLYVTSAIADGLRADHPDRRVFALTRSSFPGQQRTGGMLWSGDITATWDGLRRQLASMINYMTTGHAYWTQDIGGFFRPDNQYTSPAYHALLIRWFQFGVFTPVYRVHGYESNTEYWNYGPDVLRIVHSFTNLRYRLLPYIYSYAAGVAIRDDTLVRPLFFDHSADGDALWRVSDQYMYGREIMSAPLVTADSTRSIVFPTLSCSRWWDFWSGSTVPSGTTRTVTNLTLDENPVFVRCGSIVPLGPVLQWTSEKRTDPIEVRVYRGADASFTLYEDDGQTEGYRTGDAYITIGIAWQEKDSTVVIGPTRGRGFPGAHRTRTVNIVLVRPGVGVGIAPTPLPDVTTMYNGTVTVVHVPPPS